MWIGKGYRSFRLQAIYSGAEAKLRYTRFYGKLGV